MVFLPDEHVNDLGSNFKINLNKSYTRDKLQQFKPSQLQVENKWLSRYRDLKFFLKLFVCSHETQNCQNTTQV